MLGDTVGSTLSLAPSRNRCFTGWRSFRVRGLTFTWSSVAGMVATAYWLSVSRSSRANSSPSSSVSPSRSTNWSSTWQKMCHSWAYSSAACTSPLFCSTSVRCFSIAGVPASSANV